MKNDIVKTKIKIGFYSILLALFTLKASAQEKKHWATENIDFFGYIKYLNTSTFKDLNTISNDNLIHNRLNFKVYHSQKITSAIEIRNRVFWGSSVQSIPDYSSIIDGVNKDIDLSFFLVKKPALLAHSNIDRLYVDYHSDKWQVTLGRQRINWGKNLVWNPNDLFNAYNFFDFDNEERPGTDALRVQYFTSGNSSFETAINYTKNWKNNTLAFKYNFHKYNYDFQVLVAKYLDDYGLGVGWEGAIHNVGFKGELSYFAARNKADETENAFVGSISFDYYFKNGISLNLATLYNSIGIKKADSFGVSQFNSITLSAKQLMPNRWSYFAQISKTLTPAVTTSFSTIYAYELEGVFMMPQFTYNISQNWDVDITGQIFYGKENNEFSNLANSIFLRFRYSF